MRWFPPITRPSTAPAWKLRSRFGKKHFTSSLILGLRPTRKVLISPTLVFFSHVRKHHPPNRPFPPLTSLPNLSPPPQRKVRSSLFVFLWFFLLSGCFLPQTVASQRPKSSPPPLRSVFIPPTYPHPLPPLSSFSPSRPSPPTIHLSGQLFIIDLLSAFPPYGGFDRENV